MECRLLKLGAVVLWLSSALAAQVPTGISRSTAKLSDLKGQILILRDFYEGSVLRYDSSGKLREGGGPASWTVAEVEIVDAKVKHGHLEIHGKRKGLLYSAGQLRPVDRIVRPKRTPEVETVVIEAGLPHADEAAALEAAKRIFLTEEDRLADDVPEYWAGFFVRATSAGEAHTKSPEEVGSEGSQPLKLYQVGKGVTAPKIIFHADPEYAEAARLAKSQGTTLLSIVIGADGAVHKVRIRRPLGMGLDEKAIAAVKTWQFQPATKDGDPVTVQVDVEVNFRLY